MVRKRLALGVTAAALLAAGHANANEPAASITGVEDRALREAIQRAMTESKVPPRSRAEARRRARDAGDDAVAVLRAEGYYAYVVEPDVSEADPPRPILKITPGPVFVIADPRLAWSGAAPDEGVAKRAESVMRLTPGEPGRAVDVLAAEGRVVSQVQQLGYADATADPREVIVDHADHTVRPTFHIAAGDLTHVDGIQVITQGRSNPAWVQHLAPWKSGDVYEPEDIAELERRLRDTSVYDTVSVSLAPKEKILPDGLRPVMVTLSDRKAHTLEVGAGYSTTDGPGVDVKWIRYNRLRRADTTTLTASLAKLDSRLEAEVALPHWRRAQQTLKLNTAIFRDDTDAYLETGAHAGVDLTRRLRPTVYRTYGMAVDLSQIDSPITVDGVVKNSRQNFATFTTLAAYAWDRSDSVLDPTRGWRVEVRAEPTAITGDLTMAFVKAQVQSSAYLPFGKGAKTVIAGRFKAGQILGGTMPEVPASRRFYSGGGGSVRGYAYQAIGPRIDNTSTPQGGLSLLETSLEVRHKFTEKWGGVAFVDAGAVGVDKWPNGDDFGVGVGLGVRYDLGFGPIRADIAMPLSRRVGDPAFQLYISIGQSF
ncbi:outer membrane protein [Caulobacter sp. AP07]|uniref:autotransporter assembly complex protein TamA n=1 Tax=Caulobacter sp. AP07 TaxID=1144304 RepID=UPI000271F243|nr:autotransporter assembly complex family protein [Caulobacter sp. AP07]EJL35763.1 outer membrane protein [Caulobacter sp. AP07]